MRTNDQIPDTHTFDVSRLDQAEVLADRFRPQILELECQKNRFEVPIRKLKIATENESRLFSGVWQPYQNKALASEVIGVYNNLEGKGANFRGNFKPDFSRAFPSWTKVKVKSDRYRR